MNEKQLNALKILIRAHYDYQRERKSLDGRLGIKKNGEVKKNVPERDEYFLAELFRRRAEAFEMEKITEKEIAKDIHTHPLWKQFLQDVKGCGEMMTGVITTEFEIRKAPMVSNLVSFAGLAPGKDRKVKGKKRQYNQFLKDKLCGVLGPSFLKCHSPYSDIYYNEKYRLEHSIKLVEERMKGGKTKMVKWREAKPIHRHQAAIRKMIKHFLKDLYVAWRILEGLAVREPYSEEYLGKKHSA